MLPSILAVLAAMLSLQFGASVAKNLIFLVGVAGATTLRLGLAAIMLTVVLRPWRGGSIRPALRPLVLYGVALGVMNLLFYCALRLIPLGIAVALEFVGPLILTIGAMRRWFDLGWVALVVLGLWLLLPLGQPVHAVSARGAAYALAAGGCWALYIVFGRRVGAALGTRATALGTVVAALVIAPFGLHDATATLFAPAALSRGAVIAVFSSALPSALEMIALTRLPPRLFATMMGLEPAIAALVGVLLLGQVLGLGQWLGIAAVMAATFGTAITQDRPDAPAPIIPPA